MQHLSYIYAALMSVGIFLSITAASHADLGAITESIRADAQAHPEQASALADELADAIANASIDEEGSKESAYITLINLRMYAAQPDLVVEAYRGKFDFYEQTKLPREVIPLTNLFSTYLAAYNYVLEQPSLPASQGIEFLDMFERTYETYGNDPFFNYADRAQNLNEMRSNLLIIKAVQAARTFGGPEAVFENSGAARIVAALMAQATMYMRDHADAMLKENADAQVIDRAFGETGRLASETSALYQAAGDEGQAVQFRELGYQALSEQLELLEQGKVENLNGNNMQQLFRFALDMNMETDQLIGLLDRLKATGLKNFTLTRAVFLEAADNALDDATMIRSQRLFNVVMDLEQSWFQEEHREHTFFQRSLMISANTCLTMGDLEGAIWRIDLLNDLEVPEGSSTEQDIADLNRNLLNHTLYGVKQFKPSAYVPLDPSGWVPERNWASQANSQTQPTSTVESTPSPTPANVESPAANQFTETSATAAIQIEEDSDFGWWITIAIIVLLAMVGIYIARRV